MVPTARSLRTLLFGFYKSYLVGLSCRGPRLCLLCLRKSGESPARAREIARASGRVRVALGASRPLMRQRLSKA